MRSGVSNSGTLLSEACVLMQEALHNTYKIRKTQRAMTLAQHFTLWNAGRMSTTTPDLIGSKEACRLLGDINRSTLTRWVADGRLTPATKLPGGNGAFLFDRSAVEKLATELDDGDNGQAAS